CRALPRSSSFPYTTLFRSLNDQVGIEARDQSIESDTCRHRALLANLLAEAAVEGGQGVRQALRRDLAQHLVRLALDDLDDDPVGDRKSTRLNSSHVKISYA